MWAKSGSIGMLWCTDGQWHKSTSAGNPSGSRSDSDSQASVPIEA
ncbi:hypothetical protein HTIA_2651 [Halorhabdus tiamatea SARL4B]|uniref:Uncharacterized protein n=1 Tax=Halorhabdus tiamatea SARL4B TaxID=1033806 RepID=S6D982_9EURY|nr:hypothetical protein HTIA_2651 [Halorhabdus tiamatea SARL4B]